MVARRRPGRKSDANGLVAEAACNRRHCASATRSAALHLIQRKIQLQYVHAPLAEHAQLPPARITVDQRLYFVRRKSARFRDASDLIRGSRRADLRIESASRRCHEID